MIRRAEREPDREILELAKTIFRRLYPQCHINDMRPKIASLKARIRKTIKQMASVGSEYLWRQMGQTCQNNAYGILLRKLTRTLGVAATRANARMRLRVLGTLFGRRDDSQYNRASREEARFREAEWDNYLRHGPRGHAEYHHGFEHCI